ncbi:MAG: Unknown protein [uncultured Sulfurovum sp.]|uniref:Porin n=1 Tax=uncultured Sulfurovum sp. TaxID=269237 RepID=A0A6S6UFT8_9BACT|nr:MAG: Unknown protein [uncultured Sulfurovum sp.]
MVLSNYVFIIITIISIKNKREEMKKLTTTLSLVSIFSLGIHASSTLEDRIKALESKNEVLTEEILASQSGGFTLVDTEKSFNGLGPAASKIYFSESPFSIGGYGEMFYANPDNGDDFADIYRFITYIGYKFNDWVILNTEIEYEHGDTSAGGKAVVEFFHLDFLLSDKLNLRVGNLLVPMGITNIRHEPTLFNTIQRAEIERQLIPSTWHENGVLAYGRFDDVGIEYTAGVVNALNVDNNDAKNNDEGSADGWIRSGRIGSNKNGSFSPAFVGRIDYTGINGLVVGASAYHGNGSNLKNPVAGVATDDLTNTMFDIHGRYENGRFKAYGLYTQTNLDSPVSFGVNAVEEANGYYGNVAYDIGSLVGINYQLPVFAQYENYNPVAKTRSGGADESKYARETTTVGVNFWPADQVVVKLDYEMDTIGKGTTTEQEINSVQFGFGFIF